MYTGYFFQLSEEHFNLEQDTFIFEYTRVTCKKGYRYPIYLVIKETSIDFFFHSVNLESENELDDDKYKNVKILRIPLSDSLGNRKLLMDNLVNCFSESIGEDLKEKYKINKNPVGYNKTYFTQNNSEPPVKVKLLLDFFFDLENSNIFKKTPSYKNLISKIHSSFLLNAISKKADYYHIRSGFLFADKADEAEKTINSQKLLYAEEIWISIIRNANAEGIFEKVKLEKPKPWYKKLWLSIVRCFKKERTLEKPKSWFRKIEEEYCEVLFSKQNGREYKRNEWINHLSEQNDIPSTKDYNIDILKKSSAWFVKRYSLIKAFLSISQSNVFLRGIGYIIFLIILILGLFQVSLLVIKYDSSITDIPFAFVLLFLSILLLLFIIISLFKQRSLRSYISISLPRLIMAIASAWILATIMAEEYWHLDFDCFMFNWENLKLAVLIFLVMIVFTYIEIKNITSSLKWYKSIIRVLGILLIGLFISIFIGIILTNVTADRILSKGDFLKNYYSKLIFHQELNSDKIIIKRDYESKIKALLYLNNAIRNLDSGKIEELKQNLYREHPTSDSSTSYFNYLKYLKHNNTEQNLIHYFDFNNIKKIFPWWPFGFFIIPHMVFKRALFALFIGIFLQLIFEEKAITESL